jgi:hypothetical protein
VNLTPDQQLTHLRTLVDESAFSINDRARALALAFRDLDAHLSAGGIPPEAWREGPDAPGTDDVVQIGGAFLDDLDGYWLVTDAAGKALSQPFLTEQDAEDEAEAMREPGDTEDAIAVAYVNNA